MTKDKNNKLQTISKIEPKDVKSETDNTQAKNNDITADTTEPEVTVSNQTTEKQTMTAANKLKPSIFFAASLAAMSVICIALGYSNYKLAKRVSALEHDVTSMENNLSQNVEDSRKVYVFNMEEAVKNTGIQAADQKFEKDINELDARVKEAQEAIKNIKDEAVKAKMLNLTLKPLQMKRDDLLDAYSQAMQQSLGQINEALAELAMENNVPTIFINKSVAVNTNYVIDVTPQVVEKIKSKQKK